MMMDRRRVLKMIGISAGYTISAPALFHLLNSCKTETGTHWKPQFLSETQAFIIEQLSDIILPKGSSKGAIEVNTPQFIDLFLKDVVSKEKQNLFLRGSLIFQDKFQKQFQKNPIDGTKEEFEKLLHSYFAKSPSAQKQILEFVERQEADVKDTEKYLLYHFLIDVRKYTLLGYYTSKEIELEHFNNSYFSYTACTT